MNSQKSPNKLAIALQEELIESSGEISKMEVTLAVDYSPKNHGSCQRSRLSRGIGRKPKTLADKTQRAEAESQAASSILDDVLKRFDGEDNAETQIKAAIRSLTKELVRKRIVEEGLRIDGRTPADLRQLSSDVGILPTAHGSGLFQRGETQVLNITTLGTKRMDQMIDGIDPITRKRYMHHYNFPPFSTGETRGYERAKATRNRTRSTSRESITSCNS
ncbi:MAG: hypothetical protein Ct9H90mP30_3030 [Actinomycetota bacterium]|nr:MAG: hypothetical protein Ct9H90mP30_3030 [Actinomycetota bacterium]